MIGTIGDPSGVKTRNGAILGYLTTLPPEKMLYHMRSAEIGDKQVTESGYFVKHLFYYVSL